MQARSFPKREALQTQQIKIGTRQFSTLAACYIDGFVPCWQIYEIPITSEIFCEWLQNKVQPYVSRGTTVCMIDNARIHHSIESRAMLDQVYDQNCCFVSRYSPHLKPIESCFALVKQYIRRNELEAVRNPIEFINRAFQQFAVGGTQSNSV